MRRQILRSATCGALALALMIASGCGNAQDTSLIAGLERLAKSGDAEAIYHLGMAYQTGSGVAEDHAKALDAFRKAATLGDSLASYKLGCYYAGQGAGLVEPDPTLALRYKLVAAKAGYALAQQDVGILYAQAGDVPAGLAWIERSAAQGWSGALMTLASVYNGAEGVTRDPARTVAYFRLFLARSEPDAEQIAWVERHEAELSPADRARAEQIVREYYPAPTPLTIKALSGQRAAQALVQSRLRN
jgi:TPR repeat protein